ncbi:MAG: hypothetical protein LC620_03450, partial [Halobacteriales archaeon]|nr:hypothetical protein [Halobacteriales archaeon]
ASEPVYLEQSCGTVVSGDVRFTAAAGFPAGSTVVPSASDVANPTNAADAAYCYTDADGNTIYSHGDSVVLSLHGACLGSTVMAGDIRITSGFQRFAADTTIQLRQFPVSVGSESFFEGDGKVGFSPGDTMYLDADASGAPNVQDVRISVNGALLAGAVVRLEDNDAEHPLMATSHTSTCKGTATGNDTDDPVYLHAGACSTVASLDVRFVGVGPQAAGTIVTGAATDLTAATTALATAYCYVDADWDGRYDGADPLYLSMGSACDYTNPGDIAFAGYKIVPGSASVSNVTTTTTTPPVVTTPPTVTTSLIVTTGGTTTVPAAGLALALLVVFGAVARLRRRLA